MSREALLVRLSISANEEEWAAVRARAGRCGLSISRYLVGATLAELSAATARPALDAGDEHRLLEALRSLQPLLSETDEPDTPEMPDRLTALLAARLSSLARSGGAGELRRLLGDEDAALIAAALSPEPRAARGAARPGAGAAGGPEPRGQRALL